MNRRRKTLLLVVLAIAFVAVFWVRLWPMLQGPGGDAATSGSSLKALEQQLFDARVQHAKTLNQLVELRRSQALLWRMPENSDRDEVRRLVEELGQNAGVVFTRIDRPEVVEVTEHLQGVEVRVYANTDIGSLARFMHSIEAERPLLQWSNCLVRPDRFKDPQHIVLSGAIRALTLKPEAEALLQPRRTSP